MRKADLLKLQTSLEKPQQKFPPLVVRHQEGGGETLAIGPLVEELFSRLPLISLINSIHKEQALL